MPCRLISRTHSGTPTTDMLLLDTREYPFLDPEDIQACLLFARRSLSGEHVT